MATKLVMPRLGLTMTEGSVARWLKVEGEKVSKGEPLMEVMTDKVTTEAESPAEGVLRKILVQEGVTVPVSTVIGIIAGENDDITSILQEGCGGAQKRQDNAPGQGSPAVKRIAAELGVDLNRITGTGPGGRITERDIRTFVQAGPTPRHGESEARQSADGGPPAGDKRIVPVQGMRRTVAERMARSASETASVTLDAEVVFDELRALKERLGRAAKEKAGIGLTYTDFIVSGAAKVLRDHPGANASFLGSQIEIKANINVGVAVDVPDGLVVPVIRNADRLGLLDIALERTRLVEAARTGRLSPDDLNDGTFTVTNLGAFGVDSFTPIINLPESTILGVGRIAERARVKGGSVVPCWSAFLSLSFDHRVIDGAPAARFLSCIVEMLEHPYLLLL